MTYYELLMKDKEAFEKKLEEFKDDSLMSEYYIHCLNYTDEVLANITVEEADLEVEEHK